MLRIKENDKFFTRLLSKESSAATPSFRVYYGGVAVAVPFVWEAKPGTPKHHHRGHSYDEERETHHSLSLPPLTPPPSFSQRPNKKPTNKSRPNKILQGLFPKMMHKRQNSTASSTSSVTSAASTLSSFESSGSGRSRARTRSNPGSLFEFVASEYEDVEEEEEVSDVSDSPRSVMCFGLVGGSRKIRSGCVVDHKV